MSRNKMFIVVLVIVLFFTGLFGWGYVLSEAGGSCRKLFEAEIVVQVLLLIGSILRIGFFDYEDNLPFHMNLTITADVLISVAAFYIADIHILPVLASRNAAAYSYIIDFLLLLLVALVLGFLPAVLTAALIWALVRTCSKPR